MAKHIPSIVNSVLVLPMLHAGQFPPRTTTVVVVGTVWYPGGALDPW